MAAHPAHKYRILVLELLDPPSFFAKALVQYASIFHVDAKKLQDHKFDDLADYDVVVFGLRDAASDCYDFTEGKQKLLCTYLQQGGKVIWTHNHLDWTKKRQDELQKLTGVYNALKGSWCDTTKGLVNEDHRQHPIFRSYYNLRSEPFYAGGFPISNVHRTYGDFDAAGKSLINLVADDLNENCPAPYLYVYEGDKHKSVFLAAGHSYSFTKSEYELWVNIAAWLVGFVRYDYAGPGPKPDNDPKPDPRPQPPVDLDLHDVNGRIVNPQDIDNSTQFQLISPFAGKNFAVDIIQSSRQERAKAISWPYHSHDNQKFKYNKQDQTIEAVHSGFVLEAEPIRGSNVVQAPRSGSPNQRWEIRQNHSVALVGTNFVLDICGPSDKPGTCLCVWDPLGTASQVWYLVVPMRVGAMS